MQVLSLLRSNIRTLGVLLLVLLCAALLTAYVRYMHDRNEVDTAATEFLTSNEATPYTSLAGEPFSFEPYRGKIRVVNVFASWSPFAARELPMLETLAKTYADKGVVAIAVNRKEPRERAQAYISSLPPLPSIIYVIDETDAFYASVGGYAMPETIIFDADGNIVWHYRGEMTYELVEAEVLKLIQE